MATNPIKNIIFDLGGVLINLDFEKTFHAFEALGVKDFATYFQQSHSNPLFAQLEKGEITPAVFYEQFRLATGVDATDVAIAGAWNAMLLDFRDESMQYLVQLGGQYRVFLLSNTNQIHLEAFREIHFRQFGHNAFDGHFEKAWYSHELGLRKPDVECFTTVMQQYTLKGEETLFVDDTAINIAGAEKAGLGTCLLEKGMLIETVLPHYLA
jgi:putative hydrolase of the HAD superfamily